MSRLVNSLVPLGARLGFAVGAASVILAGCAPENEGAEPFFLTQTRPAAESMQAGFAGSLAVDTAGCIRMRGGDRHTVVWPYGFTLVSRGEDHWVVDAAGRDAGRLGGPFRFSGGEVATLAEGMGVHDVAVAVGRCPGRFWIVGGMME